MEEKNIEEKLKEDLSRVSPNRSQFDKMMASVTEEQFNRNNMVKENIPSPYQTTYSYFMKKITYISIPVVLVAAYFIFVNIKTDNNVNSLINTQPMGITAVNEQANDNQTFENQDTDSIIDGMFAEIESESSLAINDSEDEAFINSELEAYSSINTINYEETI